MNLQRTGGCSVCWRLYLGATAAFGLSFGRTGLGGCRSGPGARCHGMLRVGVKALRPFEDGMTTTEVTDPLVGWGPVKSPTASVTSAAGATVGKNAYVISVIVCDSPNRETFFSAGGSACYTFRVPHCSSCRSPPFAFSLSDLFPQCLYSFGRRAALN